LLAATENTANNCFGDYFSPHLAVGCYFCSLSPF